MDISAKEVCEDILNLLKKFKASLAEIAETHGLTTMQLAALHSIEGGYTTMGKLAQSMHCDASNATGIIDRLTALGLVVRQEDPSDRRVKLLQLTDKGRRVIDGVLELMPSRLGCDQLKPEERGCLHQAIRKLT